MIPQLPAYVSLVFGLTTLLTIWLFHRAARLSTPTLLLLAAWLGLQAALALAGFYLETETVPPRFPALVVPPVLLLVALLVTQRGRRFLDTLPLDRLTILHIVRVPVELVLYWLALNRAVPEEMTFEGRNFDIFSGLTAPIIYYFGFVKKQWPRSVLIGWNVVGLGLLVNIVATAALAVPSPFQQIAFEQPNIAILHFPFVWLPSVIVPIVLTAHFSALRQLLGNSSRFDNTVAATQ